MSSHSTMPGQSSEIPQAVPPEGKLRFAHQLFAGTATHTKAAIGPPTTDEDPSFARTINLRRIGHFSALAVALGVGAAIATAPGVAVADTTESSSPKSSERGSGGSATDGDRGSSSIERRRYGSRGDKGPESSRRNSTRTATAAVSADDDDPAGERNAPNPVPANRSDRIQKDEAGSGADDSGATLADANEAVETRLDDTNVLTGSSAIVPPHAPAQATMLLATATAIRRSNESESDTPPASAQYPPSTMGNPANQDVVLEADTMRLSPTRNGFTYSDPTASGGGALMMNKNVAASTKTTVPQFTSVVIRARGDQYRGAPIMRVTVDGVFVSDVSVTSTEWTDYDVPFAAPAGTYSIRVAFINDRYSRKHGDRNLRLDTVTFVGAPSSDPPPETTPGTGDPGFFGAANWLWRPIAADPQLDANSQTWVEYLAAPGKLRIANLYDYSVKLVSAAEITANTPRYDVTLTRPWGSDPFGSAQVPIPVGTEVPPGSDGHLAILDPASGTAYGIWQAVYDGTNDTWSGSWGGMTDLDGDGVDQSGSATAANIARYAGVVTIEEFAAAVAGGTGLEHALAFSTDLAGPGFVYPATKSDGQNWAGVEVPIPEGYRIQLNPDIDVDSIPGITPGEKVIARTLQTHGAYVVDQGAARMAFAFELADDATPTSPGSVWADAGLAWDYYDMASIPWSELRVLAVVTT